MEVTGKIKAIKDTNVVSDRFKNREVVITTDHTTPYPQHVSFIVTQDKCSVLDSYSEGEEVRAQFNLRGREWNGPQGVRYFNTLEIWKIEKIGSSQGATNANPSVSTGNDLDELPY